MRHDDQNQIKNRIARRLLDTMVLNILQKQSMHGYQIISKIHKSFGILYGPGTIYPLLNALEKKGALRSNWIEDFDRLRRVYELTSQGESMLDSAEDSLALIRGAPQSIRVNI